MGQDGERDALAAGLAGALTPSGHIIKARGCGSTTIRTARGQSSTGHGAWPATGPTAARSTMPSRWPPDAAGRPTHGLPKPVNLTCYRQCGEILAKAG